MTDVTDVSFEIVVKFCRNWAESLTFVASLTSRCHWHFCFSKINSEVVAIWGSLKLMDVKFDGMYERRTRKRKFLFSLDLTFTGFGSGFSTIVIICFG